MRANKVEEKDEQGNQVIGTFKRGKALFGFGPSLELLSYLENEMGWLEQSRIFLENAFIADEDETDAEQAYLNYLADWIFNHQGNELHESGPAGFSEWKQQNRSV